MSDAPGTPPPAASVRDTSGRIVHYGEKTARERLLLAQAMAAETRVSKERGELVPRADLVVAVSTFLAEIGTALHNVPEAAVRQLNLGDSAAEVLHALIAQARRDAEAKLRRSLREGSDDEH